MCPSPGFDSSQIEALVDARVQATLQRLLAGNALQTGVPPRSLPETALRPAPSGGQGAVLTDDGGVAAWSDPPSGAGEALVWDGSAWVPEDVATQVELDAVASDLAAHEALSFGDGHALPTAATPMNGYGFTGLGALQWNADTEISRSAAGLLFLGGVSGGSNDRMLIGSWETDPTSWVQARHSAMTASQYQLMLGEGGRVIVNANNTQYVSLRVNTAESMVINSLGAVIASGKSLSFSSSATPTTSEGDAKITRAGADWLDTPDLFTSRRASSGDQALGASVIGDSAFRLRIGASGTLSWSDGTASQDTNLYRTAANILQTDDAFRALGQIRGYDSIYSEQAATSDVAFASFLTAEASSRFVMRGDGTMEWGPGSAGRDVTLSRTAANIIALGSGDKIQQNAAPTTGDDLVNKTYSDLKVLKAGDTMSGDLTREGGTGTTRRIQARQTGDASGRAALGVLSTDVGYLALGDGTAMDWILSRSATNIAALAAGDKIQQNTAPTAGDDLTNKTYVDTATGLLIPKSLVDAKGDLVVATAADTVARVAAGADGLVPMYDDAATAGLTPRRLAVPDSMELMRALGSPVVAASLDPYYAVDSVNLADNWVVFQAIYLPFDATLTGVCFVQRTQGSYTADNNNKVGLFTMSGGTMTRVAQSANNGNLHKSAAGTFVQEPFSSTYAAAAGVYYAAILLNYSAVVTLPTIQGALTVVSGGENAKMGATYSTCMFATGQNDMPSSVAATNANGGGYLLGVY